MIQIVMFVVVVAITLLWFSILLKIRKTLTRFCKYYRFEIKGTFSYLFYLMDLMYNFGFNIPYVHVGYSWKLKLKFQWNWFYNNIFFNLNRHVLQFVFGLLFSIFCKNPVISWVWNFWLSLFIVFQTIHWL